MAEPSQSAFRPYDASAFDGPRSRRKRDVPEGLWMRCPQCSATLFTKVVQENLDVCPQCEWHFRIGARRRVEQLVDTGSFEELFADVAPADPLEFKWLGRDYASYLKEYQGRAGTSEAVLTGHAYVKGRRLALGVMNGEFIMGSMGSVVGERVCALVEGATAESLPLVIVCTSGGARMQEGALSVMQMGKTAAALARLDSAGGLYIAVYTDPTMAGVLASFGSLADIVIAEPRAMVGFAGPRVIANTIKAELPEGFQRAEFLLEHGFIDLIVHRKDLRSEISRLIDYTMP